RRSFTVNQKLKIIEFALANNVKEASMQFNIHHSMIYRWLQQKEKFTSVPKRTRKVGSGRKPLYPKEEGLLANQIKLARQSALPLTWSIIQTFMKQLVSNNSFKASYSWMNGFSKSHFFTLKTPTNRITRTQLKANLLHS